MLNMHKETQNKAEKLSRKLEIVKKNETKERHLIDLKKEPNRNLIDL